MSALSSPENPISAVTHPDPYPYYAKLVAGAPLYFDRGLGLWVASSAEHVERLLNEPQTRVRPEHEPVPQAIAGSAAGELFARLVRMNDGVSHASLRPVVERQLNGLSISEAPAELEYDPGDLNGFIERYSVYAIAAKFGIGPGALPALFERVRDFAKAVAATAQPHDVAAGSQAALALMESVGDANIAGYFFQTYDATRGLIANTLAALARDRSATIADTVRDDSPVQNTRRYIGAETYLLVIAAANRDPAANGRCFTFGFGRHACPGKALALSIAADAIKKLAGYGLDFSALRVTGYQSSRNVRIAFFG